MIIINNILEYFSLSINFNDAYTPYTPKGQVHVQVEMVYWTSMSTTIMMSHAMLLS